MQEQLDALHAELAPLDERLRDMVRVQQAIHRRTEYFEDFLNAIRREIRSSLPMRAARWFLGGRPRKAARDDEPEATEEWHEDFVRVYPNGTSYDPTGEERDFTDDDRRNYLNHVKFYNFVAQFAPGKNVLDVGCGSGYGCSMLAGAGAASVCGCDLSSHALRFAREHYGDRVEFTRQSCTDMGRYPGRSFDFIICSEVLEHLAETNEVDSALREMRRVAEPGAVFVLATPNEEMLADHGFCYDDLRSCCDRHFGNFMFFENALIPFTEEGRQSWRQRVAEKRTGLVISVDVNLDETDIPSDVHAPDDRNEMLKHGEPVGIRSMGRLSVDTRLLHNTHSFVIVATDAKPAGEIAL